MTDQERSAAREALACYFGALVPENKKSYQDAGWTPNEASLVAMHAVLTKHEAEVRQRIAYKLDQAWPPTMPAYYGVSVMAIRDKIRAIVNPPEPPKPVLCENCGEPEETHENRYFMRGRCPNMYFKPAEESAR